MLNVSGKKSQELRVYGNNSILLPVQCCTETQTIQVYMNLSTIAYNSLVSSFQVQTKLHPFLYMFILHYNSRYIMTWPLLNHKEF